MNYLTFPKIWGHTLPGRATGKKTCFGQAEAEVRGKLSTEPYWGFRGKGRISSIGLASLNNSRRLWDTEMVSSCLVSGRGKYWLGV